MRHFRKRADKIIFIYKIVTICTYMLLLLESAQFSDKYDLVSTAALEYILKNLISHPKEKYITLREI